MLFKMSDEKKTVVEPTVIIASQPTCERSGARKGRLSKKHVVIAVVALLVTGLIVTGALVGMKIYTDNNLEVVKYSLKANGVSQNVSVEDNVVTYHVQKDGSEAWIVQDFDKGIQVTKRLSGGQAACFVTALNRSLAPDASSIPATTPDTSGSTTTTQTYAILPDQIIDLSFLGKKASAMCQNIPTYHAVPDCGKSDVGSAVADNTTAVNHRSKRTPGFCGTCSSTNCRCICGCCWRVCADYSQGGTICSWVGTRLSTGSYLWVCSFYYMQFYSATALTPNCTYSGLQYVP